jgi:phospholipase/lecithinase/hemolysin
MQKKFALILVVALLGLAVFPGRAAFTLLQVFGDGISTTTNNEATGPFFYGHRFSNGRVWVEVLAERQGLTLYATNNWSYFGNTSTNMVSCVKNYTAPSGVNLSNILFVIWVNNADLFYLALNGGTDMNTWTNAMNLSLSNHFKAITNLCQKGARTLVMPNVVDLSTIPQFNGSANTNFVHQRCLDYNAAFINVLERARTNALYPGLTICMPDFFALLTNLIAYPASYCVTNALYGGRSIDALYDPALTDKTTNGPGTNYIFWDHTDPSAKVHMWMANIAQQLIAPARIDQLTILAGSNRLDLANVPVGQDGLVLGTTNQLGWAWTTNAAFSSINPTQSVFVATSDASTNALHFFPDDGPPWPPGGGGTGGTNIPPTMQLYRLQFPYCWTWP